MLTRKQHELLYLIRDRLAGEGIPPSFDEMKIALGLKSKSGIHRLIMGLEERGFIKRLPHRARALEILRMPELIEQKATKAAKKIQAVVEAIATSISLPLYGRIAAGTPIEAISTPSRNIDVPLAMMANIKGGTTGEHYVLEISGDSMIEAGIMDGDQIIVRRADTADNGAIVVALVDGQEATLKYLERRKGNIALLPANARYEPIILDAKRVKVQGRLVGLMRKY